METLNSNELLSSTLDYIKNETNDYAVLIDGDWGCGKTYFIKSQLIPQIEKISMPNSDTKHDRKYHCLYMSLYGLKSTEDISNQIYINIRNLLLPNVKWFAKIKPIVPVLGAGVKILADNLKISSVTDLGKVNFSKIIGEYSNLKKYVFIFDDLERCTLPLNEVLGYINYLVEQNGIKTFILANEKEIGNKSSLDNIELKYLVSANPNIKISTNQVSNTEKDSSQLSLEELNRKTSLLFESNYDYQKAKEKIIGVTLHYRPMPDEFLPSIIEKYKINEISSNLNFKSIIIQILEEENYSNIRTIKFALSFFQRLSDLIKHDSIFENETETNDLYVILIKDIFKVSIHFKNGGTEYQWQNNEQFGNININGESLWDFEERFYSFKFVHNYIYHGKFDECDIKKNLQSYYKQNHDYNLAINDPTSQLQNLWFMDDNEIQPLVEKLLDKFYIGGYETTSYKYILGLSITLVDIGFKIDIPKMVDKMKMDILNRKGYFNNEERVSPPMTEHSTEIYEKAIEEITSVEVELLDTEREDNLNNMISSNVGWGKTFSDYCFNHKSEILVKRSFFGKINIEHCIECLKNSKVHDIANFQTAIQYIYSEHTLYESLKSDRVNLEQFCAQLKQIGAESNHMQKFRLCALYSTLQSYLSMKNN